MKAIESLIKRVDRLEDSDTAHVVSMLIERVEELEHRLDRISNLVQIHECQIAIREIHDDDGTKDRVARKADDSPDKPFQ